MEKYDEMISKVLGLNCEDFTTFARKFSLIGDKDFVIYYTKGIIGELVDEANENGYNVNVEVNHIHDEFLLVRYDDSPNWKDCSIIGLMDDTTEWVDTFNLKYLVVSKYNIIKEYLNEKPKSFFTNFFKDYVFTNDDKMGCTLNVNDYVFGILDEARQKYQDVYDRQIWDNEYYEVKDEIFPELHDIVREKMGIQLLTEKENTDFRTIRINDVAIDIDNAGTITKIYKKDMVIFCLG